MDVKQDLSSLAVHLEEKMKKEEQNVPRWNPARSFWLASGHISGFMVFAGDTVIYAATWAVPCFILICIFALIHTRREH